MARRGVEPSYEVGVHGLDEVDIASCSASPVLEGEAEISLQGSIEPSCEVTPAVLEKGVGD